MPQRVIDALELIQVDKQQCRALFASTHMLEALFQTVLKQTAILEASQRVIKSKLFHLRLGFHALADVFNVQHDMA